jgi:hypothetical protein
MPLSDHDFMNYLARTGYYGDVKLPADYVEGKWKSDKVTRLRTSYDTGLTALDSPESGMTAPELYERRRPSSVVRRGDVHRHQSLDAEATVKTTGTQYTPEG